MTYAEVADRIEEEFGERPTYTMLRLAVSGPSPKKVAPGLTTGLPAPVSPPGKRVRFSAREIEKWIAHHPRRLHEALLRSIIEAQPEQRDQAIIAARNAGADESPAKEIRAWAHEVGLDVPAVGPVPQKVRNAYATAHPGLSWEAIAQAISTATGTTYSKQRAQQKYGPRTRA